MINNEQSYKVPILITLLHYNYIITTLLLYDIIQKIHN